MRIFYLILSQYLLGYIFQAFVCVLGLYAVAKVKPKAGQYITYSLAFSVVMIIVRNLPIASGIHTIIGLIALIGIGIFILKLNTPKVIVASILITLLVLVIETLVFLVFKAVVGANAETLLQSDELVKALLGVPINVVFLMVILAIYSLGMRKRKEINGGSEPKIG